jgi:predicted DNA-binding transcriptional regulator AlpA
MADEPARLWTVTEVAAFLCVPPATLYQWRHRGYGPRSRRVGRYLRYDPRDVRTWFASQDDPTIGARTS